MTTAPERTALALLASGATPALRLDPRTKALLVLGASLSVMAPGGEPFIPAALVLGMLLALGEGAWARVLVLPLTAAAIAVVAYLLPMALPYPAVGVVAAVAAYLLRFVAVGGIALHLARTTPPTEFTAALRAAHVPRAVTVSAAVLLRFLPTIIAEARAVRDAMRLRGIGGWGGMLRHPVLSIERFTVPLIASSLRVAEDLSAAALLRGLGSAARPTAMRPPRLGAADLAAVLVAAALAAITVMW
ncbi:energy-coupling factor transport system permease protein [Nonomuraea polychroma]|uniref:Energy-coupling factor transport system permease protein n=1 Tax=Nonomuraea polychroma TaxID=46176 RepID=A0A438LYT1_9ACTN|nr:energy-coupling factor transporter transmembrane component T [Nonomuraea polychroma]RVX38686.1 energy-coupling factor transport system permease protein [Nonomuraea polychroma]